MNELMSNEAVCRTAPATPGLLINIVRYAAGVWTFPQSSQTPG